MKQVITVLEVILPIFASVLLGVLARKRRLLTPAGNQGIQKFVTGFCLPCVVFNSCLNASIGAQALASMALVILMVLPATLWAFGPGKKRFSYHNLPMLLAAQETGMLGIPLFMTLFGSAEAYRVGVLDLAQAVTAFPVIAILTADVGENPTVGQIVRKVFRSPLLIMALLGLGLNLSGAAAALESLGLLGLITGSTEFLAQPVSAAILFSVGYNFSLTKDARGIVLRLCGIRLVYFILVGIVGQLALCLIPGVEPLTRWAMLLYSILPASYLAPSMGKEPQDALIASGVCSVLTVISLLGFCLIAAIVA